MFLIAFLTSIEKEKDIGLASILFTLIGILYCRRVRGGSLA